MYTPISSTLRYTLPRVEQRAMDRRSGAYPTKKRTGDSTRSGANKFYFDDTRTIVFATNTDISLPTTFATNTDVLAADLTSSFVVTGSVQSYAVDQWIPHREQVETLGPFKEVSQYEQDENAVVNSKFMTGAAFAIAPDRFKSKISNKTIIRINVPLTKVTSLSPLTGAIHYLNPVSGGFDLVAYEHNRQGYTNILYPVGFAPLLFTPYGMHHLPIKELPRSPSSFADYDAKNLYKQVPGYASDGSDPKFLPGSNDSYSPAPATASVINTRHAANVSQSIDLAQYISHPFLLEKIVVELPFQAGPGWLNDRFGMRSTDTNQEILDVGGPLITFGFLRQDRTGLLHRDLIASGTVTNVLDVTTGSYHVMSTTFDGNTQIAFTPEGLGHLINPSVVITGTSSPSGTNNYYTGSVKLIMEPTVTSHVYRGRTSGSANWHYVIDGGVGRYNVNDANAMSFGSPSKRTGLTLQTSRNVLGNHYANIPADDLDGYENPIATIDTQYESLTNKTATVRRVKFYNDVVAKTVKSPYLLYPGDDLIFAVNKHRAVGTPLSSSWTKATEFSNAYPLSTVSTHDVQIPTGTLRITLYGDLVKEDREFHDTLNQRLETVELWETIGEEPTLDQFDVTYADELSGSFIDRNNIFTQFPYIVEAIDKTGNDASGAPLITSPILDYDRDVGNFGNLSNNVSWAELAYATGSAGALSRYYWLNTKTASELRKSHKNTNHKSTELFWDTRIPHPLEACYKSNPRFLVTDDSTFVFTVPNIIWAGEQATHVMTSQGAIGTGIKDWYMTYPYEPSNSNIKSTFFESLTNDTWPIGINGTSTTPKRRVYTYDELNLEVGVSGSAILYYGSKYEFAKVFYGIGDGTSKWTNQWVKPRVWDAYAGADEEFSYGADIRGWRYGLMNAFPVYSTAVFRRDRYGHFRDMLEQRVDAKFYDSKTGAKEAPVQVKFYDANGNITDPLRTLSSNLSYEATSSVPYTDGIVRNRSAYNESDLNVATMAITL